MGDPPVLRLEGLSRRFGQVQALDGVSLTLRGGEVHALMGENGAGKSTLIRLVAGLDRPDAGGIVLGDHALPGAAPAAMRAAGLRFIHQELHAVRGLSVAENMHLDHPYPRRAGLVNWRALNRAAREALARLGVADLDVRRPMTDLTTGQQMIARIAATLIDDAGAGDRPAWLYVMDEPTAALTGEEAERLFEVIGGLTARGAGVLYVSHRMPEVLRLAHRVTVLRDGRHISTLPLSETGQERIIREMTGRDLSALFPERGPDRRGAPVLEAKGLSAPGLHGIDFTLRSGEIRRREWDDIERDVIRIPAARMKARRDHVLPLTTILAAHIETQPRWEDSPLVFPGQGGRPMSDMTIAQAMRRTGLGDYTPNGWRSTFRDWAGQQGCARELAEYQMAHSVGSATERAYARDTLVEARRPMMVAWEEFLGGDSGVPA